MRPVTKPKPSITPELLADAEGLDGLTSLRLMLQDTIGYYCSFCEMPITVNQAVASKRTRGLKRLPSLNDWDDLLLACDYCQLHRTTDVSDLTAYLWPDIDATFSLSGLSPFIYALRDVTYVVIKDGTRVTSTKQMVLVSANPMSPKKDQAQRTIDLFALNSPFYDARTNTYTITFADEQSLIDRRVEMRTNAWGLAQYTVSTMRQAKALDPSNVFFDNIVSMSITLAQATGFWSGWMMTRWGAFADTKLIQRMLIDTQTREGYQLVGNQTEPDGGTPPWTIFTGTAVNRLQE